MATTYLNARQRVNAVVVTVNGTLTTGNKIALEPGTLYLGGRVKVLEAVAGTSPTMTLTDNSSTPVVYMSAQAVGTVNTTAALTTGAGTYYPAGGELTFTTGGTPTAGTGKVLIQLEYIVAERQEELYGRSA